MKKFIKISNGKKSVLSLLIVVSLGFLGCATVGQVVPADQQIAFSETGKSGGSYKSGGCTVEYSYDLAGEKMNLRGSASYRTGVDSLDVRVLFLDGTGSVMEQKIVFSTGYRTGKGRGGGFQEALVMPPGAAGIAFTCSAKERRGKK